MDLRESDLRMKNIYGTLCRLTKVVGLVVLRCVINTRIPNEHLSQLYRSARPHSASDSAGKRRKIDALLTGIDLEGRP